MGRSGYTSLSLDQKRYAKLRRNFDTTIETESTFTVWATSVLENSIDRVKFLEKAYPNLKVIKVLSNGVIIDDSQNDDVIKVTIQGKKLVCSDKSDKAVTYVNFACLHPEFSISV